MSKHVGIVTFHHALSYGAVLQTYGLQTFLADNGLENEVVNYRCKFIEDRAKVIKYIKGKSLKSYIYYFLRGKETYLKRKKTQEFDEKYLKLTKPYTKENIADCVADFDFFIAGSDQIWSSVCAGFDPVYFLDFANSNQKYSYAASFGTASLPQEKKAEYTRRLQDFKQISVREESGREYLTENMGKEAFVHIDPTFLLKREQWDQLVKDKAREPYIFLFTVLKPVELVNYARKLSQKTGLPIIALNAANKVRGSEITYLDPVCADEFVELIKNAEYVCTNSFHGNAFSLIYHKHFVVETDVASGENNRSKELMYRLGLEGHILAKDRNPDICSEIDWETVDRLIAAERERAREYLLSIADMRK